jgi:hypothetical protein
LAAAVAMEVAMEVTMRARDSTVRATLVARWAAG